MAVGSVKILLVIVLLLGLVLIFGYHKLTLEFWISDDGEKQTSDDSGYEITKLNSLQPTNDMH